MKNILFFFAFITCVTINSGFAQEPSHYNWGPFTRADSLRGNLSPLRSCYDVTYYNLDIAVDTADKSIKGSNTIRFKVVNAFDKMQVDLFANMNVDKIEFEDGNAFKVFTRSRSGIYYSSKKS